MVGAAVHDVTEGADRHFAGEAGLFEGGVGEGFGCCGCVHAVGECVGFALGEVCVGGGEVEEAGAVAVAEVGHGERLVEGDGGGGEVHAGGIPDERGNGLAVHLVDEGVPLGFHRRVVFLEEGVVGVGEATA